MKKLIFILLVFSLAFGQIITSTNFPYYLGARNYPKVNIDTIKVDDTVIGYMISDSLIFPTKVKYISGVNFTGYLTSKRSRVFAFLNENDTTVIVTADSLHMINGIFVNSPIYDFEIANGRLVYKGTDTLDFDIDIAASVASNTATTLIHVAIKNDDSTYYRQKMGGLAKYVNEPIPITAFLTLTLAPNDSISIMTEADKVCELDYRHVTTRIRRSD